VVLHTDIPVVIAMLAVLILIQVLFNSRLPCWLNRRLASHAASPAPRH